MLIYNNTWQQVQLQDSVISVKDNGNIRISMNPDGSNFILLGNNARMEMSAGTYYMQSVDTQAELGVYARAIGQSGNPSTVTIDDTWNNIQLNDCILQVKRNNIRVSSDQSGINFVVLYQGDTLNFDAGTYYMQSTADISEFGYIARTAGGGGGQPTDYATLTNKPTINGVTLDGNQTTATLGITNDITAITGDLATLTTTNKTTLVSASNEINANVRQLQQDITTLASGIVYVGKITHTEQEVTTDPTLLTQFVQQTLSRAPRTGDFVVTSDNIGFIYDGTAWANFGSAIVNLATATTAGLVKLGTSNGQLEAVGNDGTVQVKGWNTLQNTYVPLYTNGDQVHVQFKNQGRKTFFLDYWQPTGTFRNYLNFTMRYSHDSTNPQNWTKLLDIEVQPTVVKCYVETFFKFTSSDGLRNIRVNGLDTPTDPSDATPKNYVDNIKSSLKSEIKNIVASATDFADFKSRIANW